MNKHVLLTMALLLGGAIGAFAARLSITMNATTTTMTLTDHVGTPVVEDSHQGNTYIFNNLQPGDYVLSGYNTTGIFNGTLTLSVGSKDLAYTIWTASLKATNTGWTVGTDYTIENVSMRTREGVSFPVTIGYNTNPITASTTGIGLVIDGGTFNCDYVPSVEHEAEGYVTGYGSGTFTANAATCQSIVPLGGTFTCSCPADAEMALFRKLGGANGSGSIHYVPFVQEPLVSKQTMGGITTYTYLLGDSVTYNIRAWKEGGLTHCTQFRYSNNAAKCPVIAYTEADFEARDPKWIDHDPSHNERLNSVDILININEKNYKTMSVGEQFDLLAERDWQIIPDQTSNYFFEPDYHYAVYDLDGNPDNSVVEVEKDGLIGSQWAVLRAKAQGTAIVTVTFDAACATKWSDNGVEEDYYGGRYFCALWPENTAVFVVTVGAGANTINPNMRINEAYNVDLKKNAGIYVDAEHDVFYYVNDEEAYYYTFSPSGVQTVEISYPTIRTNDAIYNTGFQPVAKNADDSYTLALRHGRQIVRLGDGAGNYVYQVLTAKHATRTITNNTTGSTTIFQPGDEVKIQYDGLYHPANKLSGIYNMSAYITYNGVPSGTALILGSNQYWFAGTPSAQAVMFTIPYSHSEPTITLSDGVIQVTGYGDPIGNHRLIDKVAGRSPNFTAVAHQTYFGAVPDVVIPVTMRAKTLATLVANPAEASMTVYDVENNVITPNADGKYLLMEGDNKVLVEYPGYKRSTMIVTIDKNAPADTTIAINLVAIPENGWDGENVDTPICPNPQQAIYHVQSGYQLAWIAQAVNKGTAAVSEVILDNDIDLCGYDWTPIGNSSKQFTGKFIGQGHTIDNLYINSNATYQGLFGYLKSATVQDVTIRGLISSTACSNSTMGTRIGGLTGMADGTSTAPCKINHVTNYVDVTGARFAGGLVGYVKTYVTVDKCANYGNITALKSDLSNSGQYAAGIVGSLGNTAAASCFITNSYNRGTILGDNYVGGIHSTGLNLTVTNVYNTGYVHASGENESGYSCHGAIRPTGNTIKTTDKTTNAYATQDFLFNELSTTIIEDLARWQSGEVAYLLGDAFGQEIGVDELPVIGGLKVYKIGDGEEAFYSNSPAYEITEGDNSYVMSETEGQIINVQLNRGLEADVLYTLCLPFSMTEEQVDETFGEGTEIWYLTGSEDRGSLIHIDFAQVHTIEAGVPYLFRPTKEFVAGLYIANVQMSNTCGTTLGSSSDYITMTGFVNETAFSAGDAYFLGEDDYLHQLGVNRSVPGLRVFFRMNNVPAGVKARIVLGPQTATDIKAVQTDVLYEKRMINGQLFIIRDGHMYNAQGQIVR